MKHVDIVNPNAASRLVLICEHASCFIPPQYNDLGLEPMAQTSHAAWDPGALPVAKHLAKLLDAVLIAGTVSRLVYDCNRPSDAPGAMPAHSEVFEIPGNVDISDQERQARTENYYEPFRRAVAQRIAKIDNPIIVTIHSFSPVYHGQTRAVEIGVLYDADTRLADALMDVVALHSISNIQRNQPYGPEDGVTHTLKEHALKNNHLNVMLEIRNDLIETPDDQEYYAKMIAGWITGALTALGHGEGGKCTA
ncbi:N-formylglutamate amidohydrolase [Amylibacter marinus]|uniref:N-formylglutamate amidohydrolase n=1 Tax=Amylibacter marinus TaxID=1475483 RepID=A0ABQ5VSK9_9RHOB|nr:N-formylglutamate amidohydrolase [Amylibacter marinus]GLQ34169.1 N-formylglutamate amidohydrolase [Amylibacter marinus]